MNGANGANGASGVALVQMSGGLVRPLGVSPWPSIEQDPENGSRRLIWRGQARPHVQPLPEYSALLGVQQHGPSEVDLQALKRRGFSDETLLCHVRMALERRRRPTASFIGWTPDNRSVAAISQFAATGGWTGLEGELGELNPKPEEGERLAAELDMLMELMPYRDGVLGEAMAQRNSIIAYFQGLAGFTENSHPRTTELCGLSLAIGEFVVMHYKAIFVRPRPSTLCPELMPPIEVPGHPAFPSGHATESHLIARLIAAVLPADHPAISLLLPLAHRIAINREVLGLHYRSDSEAGEILAERTFTTLLDAAGWIQSAEAPPIKSGTRLIIPGSATPPRVPKGTILGEMLSAVHAEWRVTP